MTFGGFIYMGISHIGATASEWIGPRGFHLPEGIDHVLFLVALALGSAGLWQTAKAATGFTLGHSLTLALAAIGIVRPPSRWVEAAIALSIAYLAAESFLARGTRHRWKIAAVFGLVHGLGFASALRGLRLETGAMARALLGFNLGVEIGQIMILATLVPLISVMRQEPVLRKFGLRPCSLGVLGAGAYWFATRLLG